jgi:hypothetical protein
MGVSTSVPQFVGKIDRFAVAQNNVAKTGVAGAAKAVSGAITAELLAATHGTARLSGVGRQGARLGVRTVITHDRAVITASGPWQFIEGDTRKHDISPKGRRTGKRGRPLKGAKALTIGGEFYASAKQTGGSKGKRPFGKGAVAGQPLAKAAFEVAETAAMREVFG